MIPLIRFAPAPALYIRAWRHALAGGRVRFERYGREYDASDFALALDRRITARGGTSPRWRKLNPDYQTELARDAQELHDHVTQRLRLWGLNGRRWRTDSVQRRLGHLFSEDV